jgi:hypothetical protein
MSSRDEYLEELISNLRGISLNGDSFATVRAIRAKSDALNSYAESQIPFIDTSSIDEGDAHTLALRGEALALREQCDIFLRSAALENFKLPVDDSGIREAFLDLCARAENIFNRRKPEFISPLDEVMLGAKP